MHDNILSYAQLFYVSQHFNTIVMEIIGKQFSLKW